MNALKKINGFTGAPVRSINGVAQLPPHVLFNNMCNSFPHTSHYFAKPLSVITWENISFFSSTFLARRQLSRGIIPSRCLSGWVRHNDVRLLTLGIFDEYSSTFAAR